MKVLFNQQDLAKMTSLMASVTCQIETCSTAEECQNESGEVWVSNLLPLYENLPMQYTEIFSAVKLLKNLAEKF